MELHRLWMPQRFASEDPKSVLVALLSPLIASDADEISHFRIPEKAGVMEHPQVTHHVDLLINPTPGIDFVATDRDAFHLVIRFIE
ncbi:MAG: hypothetical protein HQ518_20575 [Rhodopirellula sp.]|nr:hypothetical protein [Rhodopirellula sp.]